VIIQQKEERSKGEVILIVVECFGRIWEPDSSWR